MISTWFRVTVRCYLYLWNDYYIFFFHSFVVWQAWNNIQVGVAIIFSFSIIWNFGLYFRSNYVIILISFLKHVGDLHANNQCCINRIDQWTSISSWNSCVSDKRGYFRTEATNIRKPFAFVPSDIISHFESYNILWFFFFFLLLYRPLSMRWLAIPRCYQNYLRIVKRNTKDKHRTRV